jgi:hypothetical protein
VALFSDRLNPVGPIVSSRLEGRERDLGGRSRQAAPDGCGRIPVSPEIARAAILLATVPSGFFGIPFAVNYCLDPATVGSMVTASTGLSLVTTAIAIAVLSSH